MTIHAKDALRSTSVSQIIDFALAIATPKAAGAESLIPSQDGQIFDFASTRGTAIGAVVAYQRSITEKKEVGVIAELGITGIASKAVDVPSAASYRARGQYRASENHTHTPQALYVTARPAGLAGLRKEKHKQAHKNQNH